MNLNQFIYYVFIYSSAGNGIQTSSIKDFAFTLASVKRIEKC